MRGEIHGAASFTSESGINPDTEVGFVNGEFLTTDYSDFTDSDFTI
jgi:hypothetical protein